MICLIVGNGGYICVILSLFLFVANSFGEKITTVQDFCSDNSFIRNIEPGDSFKLTFKSAEQKTHDVNKWYKKSKRKCRQEYKTSDASAHFAIAISNMNIPSCDDNCRCNYFQIEESGHRTRFCGTKDTDFFSSKSDKLSIEFHHGSTMRFDVSLTFTVERNTYFITGTPKDSIYSSNFIESPYFPTPYPPNYRAEYILQSNDPSSHVSLLFLDFQISAHSFIEVFGNNGTHLTRFYGDVFRPPIIISQSSELSFKFQSNDQPGMPGFRALSAFIKNSDTLVVPYTDCGESKDGRGGHINIKTHERFGLYDCIWHIVPFTPFSRSNLSIFTHMRNISYKSTLEFRSGSNSKSEVIKEINCDEEKCENLDIETIVPASDYMYIRFIGYLDVFSVFNLSYSTYHMGDCSDREFKCGDGRCMSSDFKCDGVPHCPDGSDEEFCPPSPSLENEMPSVKSIQKGSLHSEDSYAYIVLIGGLGLISVIVSILIFAYKHYCKKSPTQSFQIPTSEELTDVQPDSVDSFNSDNPPSYDDFTKFSNFYPPLLYNIASQSYVPKSSCSLSTTSFCSVGRYSADSFVPRNSDINSEDLFLNISGGMPHLDESHNAYNVELMQNLSFKTSKNTVKRWYSLDSKLNDLVNHDSCHLLLSIVHPSCTHGLCSLPQVQWYTLPPNFKYTTVKNCDGNPKGNEGLKLDSNINLSKDRRLTWSFVPCSHTHSEFIVKTRCISEPTKSVGIQCSLY